MVNIRKEWGANGQFRLDYCERLFRRNVVHIRQEIHGIPLKGKVVDDRQSFNRILLKADIL